MSAAAVSVALSLLSPLGAMAAPPRAVSYEPPAIVVIAVPDLRWDDLAAMPRLRAFAQTATVGNLSVKTPGTRASCADGLLTFAAGNRVAAGVNACEVPPTTYFKARHKAATGSFGARVGALGDALFAAHLGTGALDATAVPMIARSSYAEALAPSDVVDAHLPVVSAVVDDDLYRAAPSRRAAAAQQLDRQITGQLAELPEASYLVIAGISDGPSGPPHLHPLFISHPGWPHVELARPGSHPPYVELIDLAPTILHWLGRSPPDSMSGRVLRLTAAEAQEPALYDDQDRHAQAARTASKPVRWTMAIVALAVVLLFMVMALARRGDEDGDSAPVAALATWLARLVVGLPVGVFLLQLVPWWRWSGVAVGAALAALALLAAVAMAMCARRTEVGALLLVPAVTLVVLLLDQLVKAPLQLSAPLGDNPLVAGRFHGMGNIDFALFAAAALLCAGVVGGHLVAAGSRSEGVLIAGLIAGVALVVDGAPSFGDDAGGAVALLPAVAVLLGVLLGIRITWQRVASVVVVAVAAVFVVGIADHARGARAQTHLGRFIGQVVHGGAATVVQRRASAVGRSFGNIVFTLLVLAVIAAVVVCWGEIRRRTAPVPGLTAALAAVAVLAVLGSLLNDSGVAVAAFVLILTVGALGGSVLTAAPAGPAGGRSG